MATSKIEIDKLKYSKMALENKHESYIKQNLENMESIDDLLSKVNSTNIFFTFPTFWKYIKNKNLSNDLAKEIELRISLETKLSSLNSSIDRINSSKRIMELENEENSKRLENYSETLQNRLLYFAVVWWK